MKKIRPGSRGAKARALKEAQRELAGAHQALSKCFQQTIESTSVIVRLRGEIDDLKSMIPVFVGDERGPRLPLRGYRTQRMTLDDLSKTEPATFSAEAVEMRCFEIVISIRDGKTENRIAYVVNYEAIERSELGATDLVQRVLKYCVGSILNFQDGIVAKFIRSTATTRPQPPWDPQGLRHR